MEVLLATKVSYTGVNNESQMKIKLNSLMKTN